MVISVPTGDYEVPLDIAIAACDHMGATPITSFQQNSKVAARLSFRYDKVRKYELERNLWVFSIRNAVTRPLDITSMTVTFGTWSATATYVLGSIVLDPTTNKYWQATGAVATNVAPSANPGSWEQYFGPQIADVWSLTPVGGPQPWTSITNYAAGVDVVGSDSNVYLGLTNGNLNNNPVTDGGIHWQEVGPAPIGPGYYAGDLVYYPGTAPAPGIYLSLVSNNVQQPNTVATWVSTQIYNNGATVTGSDTSVYQSKVDVNVNINPVGDAGVHWIAVPGTQVDTPQGQNWLLLGAATAASIDLIYPLGFGPSSQTFTKNLFPLPYGWLREAPQDPKGGQLTWLGGPANNIMSDWNYENGYITSQTFTPIVLRFGADVIDVSKFDPMFCELFAARLALEAVETVTQDAGKKAAIGAEYQRWGNEARMRNGIEIGPVQEDEDEWISVRR